MAQETQDFLDEVKKPSLYTPAQRRAVLRTLATTTRDSGQQVAKLKGLLQDAEIVEDNALVSGQFELLFQRLNAMLRCQEKMAQEARALRNAEQGFKEIMVQLRVEAANAGYTVR